MLQTITRDILSLPKGIICHQTNCRNRMGLGLAFDIRHKWPIVYHRYGKLCNSTFPQCLIGECQLVEINEFGLWVANIFGQMDYGNLAGMCYTSYEAVHKAFKKLSESKEIEGLQVYVPFEMGCGLAGGDWEIYSSIIEKYIPTAIVCQKPTTSR